MSVFDTLGPPQPTVEQGALRVKRTLAQTFQQVENALAHVREISERHGTQHIRTALGDDWVEVAELYQALKLLVERHKPDSTVPNL